MKIVNCALLYADGDKYVWSVVTEGASEFPIDMDLVADGSVWENDGVKSVLTDGEWVAESSGGGGYKTAQVEFILDGISNALVSGAFTVPSGYVYASQNVTSSIHGASVLCADSGAPSELSISRSSGYAFVASQGNIEIQDDARAYVFGDGTITIGEGGVK